MCNLKKYSFLIAELIVLILFFGYFVFAQWTEPTAAPPGDNVDPPINVGSATQVKTGAIEASGFADSLDNSYFVDPAGDALGRSAIFAEKVGIGTTAPNQVLEIDSGHIGFNTVVVPGACTAALAGAGAGNVDNGTHSYRITFVTAEGGETSQGPASNVVTVVDKTVNGKVSLTNIPISSNPRVAQRKIYRQKAGGGNTYYLDTIADNITTSYIDNTADIGLGARSPIENKSAGMLYRDGNQVFFAGDDSTYLGKNTGSSVTASARYNVFVGAGAGEDDTSGYSNTFLGYKAGANVTTRSGNTFVGYAAGMGTALGANRTVAIGAYAGDAMTTGVDMTILLGTSAGTNITTGHSNTLLGYNTGGTLTTGDANILIGYGPAYVTVDVPTPDTNNYLNIGNTIYGDLSTKVVGIDIITPVEKLDVAGAIKLGMNDNENAGTIRWNAGVPDFEGYVGAAGGWTSLTGGGGGTGDIDSVNTPGTGLIGGQTSGDVDLYIRQDCDLNEILKWDGASSWDCATDATGGGGLPAGNAGDTLRHDGSNWLAGNVLYNDGTNAAVNGNLTMAGAILPDATANNRDLGSATNYWNKLYVQTIDPVYEIDGEKYATYVSDFAGGVRTETAGLVKLQDTSNNNQTNSNIQNSKFQTIIDFNNLEKGSDLWLFWETSNKNIADIVVLLTPGFDGRVWYEKQGNKLIIYGNAEGEVSYRLTMPRLDTDQWPNLIND